MLYYALGAIGETPGFEDVFGDSYVASRDSENGQWETDFTSPPPNLVRGWTSVPRSESFGADLSQWFHIASSREQYEVGLGQPFRGALGDIHEAIGPLLTPLSGSPEGVEGAVAFKSEGSSADGSRLFFTGDRSVTYLPGDPTPSPGADRNTYITGLDLLGSPSLQLLARDSDGKVWGGACGATVGGNSNPAHNRGAISEDGSRVFFTARPAQPATGACDSANRKRIMVREETSAGVEIRELFSSPAGVGDDLYQGASIEGSRVFFTTARSLVISDVDTTTDLYLFDSTKPVGEELVDISGVGDATPQVIAISGDGSRVFLNSTDVLSPDAGPGITGTAQAGQNNLYVYDVEAGEVSFIARTTVGSAWAVPVLGSNPAASGAGGDGLCLVFTSSAALTADDTDGGFSDVFRYDSDAHSLVRVSKAEPDGSDNGPFHVFVGLAMGDSGKNAPDFVGKGRWVSEDCETVGFKSIDGLVGDDNNGILDSYMSRQDDVFRLPGTTDPTNGTVTFRGLQDRPLVAPDGDTVFFQTFERLLPRDGDTASDVYAVRVGGGFPEPKASESCMPNGDESCQGQAAPAPGAALVVSSSLAGSGNLSESPPRRCRKGKRRVMRNGRARCVPRKASQGKKKAHRSGKAKRANRRAGK